MADGELIALQVAPEVPRTEASESKTDMLLAPSSSASRLRHFPEEVYDLSAESHLVRFVKVLLGDAGAGQLRKRLMVQRMQSTLQGTHFYDLDRFYGPLFGLRRSVEEVLDFDPYTQNGITSQWDETLAKDASFRSRIEQFAKALTYGATPTGMELIAEALLAVDCDVYESYIQADESYQTYAELEAQYGDAGTYAEMEGVSYGTLEGEGLARMSGNERRVFTVRPKRRISLAEARDLRRVLSRIKPADTRFIIDYTGIPLHEPLPIGGVVADSDHWEVISEVTAPPGPLNPYPNPSMEPQEQPRPPFTGYQGEAWSYNADLTGAVAYARSGGEVTGSIPTQRITYADSSIQDFPPQQAVLPRRVVQAGRVVSDGILVSHPYPSPRGVPSLYQDRYVVPSKGRDISTLYADGVPLDALNTLLKNQSTLDPYQQNPEHRYWVTPERYMVDGTEEVLEVRLTGDRLINYISFETARFPHEAVVEVYETISAKWTEVHRQSIYDSTPRLLPTEAPNRGEHPHHSHPGHWEKVSVRTQPVTGSRLRVRMHRLIGNPPQMLARRVDFRQPGQTQPVPYSLALRSLDLGYRVTSRADFDSLDPDGDRIIASTRDIAGSLVQFRLHEHKAENLLGDAGYWRSEPQPVNYAVVNLYLDTRGEGNGDGTVVDRFYLDPTHVGAHFSIYYSNDPQDTDGTEAFYEDRFWTPIPRDYTLQKGYVHLPPTRARYWKFEFTGLTAEPYETLLPITRRVRLFSQSMVEAMHRNYGQVAADVPSGMLPAINAARESRYSDAVVALTTGEQPVQTYRDTDALYFPDPNLAERLRNESWVFGFTPWHQGDHAPRFSQQGRHLYETAEVRHTTKVAFFVGLRKIEAYRTKWEEDDDTQVYFDTFDDFRNLTPGFTWTFQPGYMTSATLPQSTVEATSRTFLSLHNVEAVQFATEQTEPVQLIPDDDFKDPRLATYGWDNPDDYLRVGDAQLIYSASDHSVMTLRYVIPPPVALERTGGIVQEPIQPVFAQRPFEYADHEATEDAEGGLASPLVGLSPEGRVYAAARFTLDSDLTSPLWLQIVDESTGDLLIEKSLTGRRGETVEGHLGYDIPRTEMAVRVRLVQRGQSADAWRVDTLSLFEDAIIWEFSVNGGGDWYPANGIKNNDNGVLTFPEVGNQLRYRVRTHRPFMWVSAIKIRPWYVGTQNVRPGGTHRGPNLSVYDQDIPIHEDPMFTSWKKPIPYGWFAASRRYPLLPVEGVPNVGEFSRFYGRPIAESVQGISDGVAHLVIQRRKVEERLDFMHPTLDSAKRKVSFFRRGADAGGLSSDAVSTLFILGIPKPITGTIVKPVFSERNLNE